MKRSSLLLVAVAAALHGQVALYVQDGESMALVQDARKTAIIDCAPMIERNGQLEPSSSRRYALQPVPEYAPILVTVRNFEVKTFYWNYVDIAEEMNHDFIFSAEFEAPYPLDHVFMALELIPEKGNEIIFLREIGTLAAHEPHLLSETLPVQNILGRCRYRLHIFVKGREVLNSLMPAETREEILDHMVARRVDGAPDGPPQLFIDPAPAYPESLLKSKVTGEVVVRIHIDTRGRVQDPQVVKASDPAFGAAALEAVKMWRFLPLIRHGQPVATAAEMPFSFAPPPPAAGGG
ncbi:MAG TPA: energy transducer TonB [Opitutaceae bacterium]|nr:energy transducer TonB [Opitutaceae bacterium]